MVNAVQAYAWTANGASWQYPFVARSPICFNEAEGEKVPRHHICLNSQNVQAYEQSYQFKFNLFINKIMFN